MMKRVVLVLFAAAFAVTCLMIAGQPAVAGSDKAAKDQTIEEKAGSAIQTEKVNINTANLKILSALNGIGPERAKKIIDYRSKNGNFESIEEVKNVKGIGDKIYSQISSQICVK
jgi:competence protein ComEA